MKTAADIQCARDLLAGFAHTQSPVDFMLEQVANYIAAHRERETAALRKDSERLRWLHTGGGSGARKEWGVAEIEFDANGKVIGALWGFSDSSDIDKAMEAEFADENPALAMNRPETYGLPETH